MAAVLSGSIVLSGIFVSAAGGADTPLYPEKEHSELDFSQIEFTGYEDTQLKEALAELEEICGEDGAGKVDRVLELYHVVEEEFNRLQTQLVLCEIRTKQDVTDKEMQEAELTLTNQANVLSDEAGRVLKLVLDSAYRDELSYEIGEAATAVLDDYTPMEDWYLELSERETRLTQEYYERIIEDVSVNAAGEEWSFDRFYEEMPEERETYYEVTNALYKARNEKVLPILQELIEVRNDLAVRSGYENYADYAYDVVYGRDYYKEELEELYRQTKEIAVPLEEKIYTYSYYRGYQEQLYDFEPLDGEEILDLVEPQIADVDERLLEAYHYLREHHTYDIEEGEWKADAGFTVPLAEYGSAFIFNAPGGSIDDVRTVIHEFGHYNATFHDTTPAIVSMTNIDVAEIQSQGLEMLTAQHADGLVGDKANAYRAETIERLLSSVTTGCFFDELQFRLYEEPEMNAEEINRLAKDLAQEYGFYFPEGTEYYYAWVEVAHTFEQPMYYISYAVSALSALDIGAEAYQDRDSAVDRYMRLSAIDSSLPYREAVKELGLTDIFEEGGVEKICAPLEKMAGINLAAQNSGATSGESSGQQGTAADAAGQRQSEIIVGSIVLAGILFAVLASILVLRRNRRRRRAQEEALAAAQQNAGVTEDLAELAELAYEASLHPENEDSAE